MSIYLSRRKDGPLKSPYWQFDFVLKIDGERHRFHGSTGETKGRAAREWEQKEKIRVKSEGPLDHMTLAAACYRYSLERGPNIATADDQDKAFEHYCRLIGNARRLVNITSADIATAVQLRSLETVGRKRPRPVRPATANRQIVEPMQRLMRRARRLEGQLQSRWHSVVRAQVKGTARRQTPRTHDRRGDPVLEGAAVRLRSFCMVPGSPWPSGERGYRHAEV